MAINVVIPLLIPLEEDLHNATRLLSGSGRSMIEFSQNRYCAVVREDAPPSSDVIKVVANHKEGARVQYSISGGNEDGLFSIDGYSGVVTLAASLDHELFSTHEIIVSGVGGGQVGHAIVRVSVTDVNDNAPSFVNPDPHVTIIEEDDRHLPSTLLKVEAEDPDESDRSNLRYSLKGDGVDGFVPSEAYFTIDSRTGDLIQLRALDRDPPNGKRIWRLRVQVRDGQSHHKRHAGRNPQESSIHRSRNIDEFWNFEMDYQNDEHAYWNPGIEKDDQEMNEYFSDPFTTRLNGSFRNRSDYAVRERTYIIEPHIPWNKKHQTKKRARSSKEFMKLKKRPFSERGFDDLSIEASVPSRQNVHGDYRHHIINSQIETLNIKRTDMTDRTIFRSQFVNIDKFGKANNKKLTNRESNRLGRHRRIGRESHIDKNTEAKTYSLIPKVNSSLNNDILDVTNEHHESVIQSKENSQRGPYLREKNLKHETLFQLKMPEVIGTPDCQINIHHSADEKMGKGMRLPKCKSSKADVTGQEYIHQIRETEMKYDKAAAFPGENADISEYPTEITYKRENSPEAIISPDSTNLDPSGREEFLSRKRIRFEEEISQYAKYESRDVNDEFSGIRNPPNSEPSLHGLVGKKFIAFDGNKNSLSHTKYDRKLGVDTIPTGTKSDQNRKRTIRATQMEKRELKTAYDQVRPSDVHFSTPETELFNEKFSYGSFREDDFRNFKLDSATSSSKYFQERGISKRNPKSSSLSKETSLTFFVTAERTSKFTKFPESEKNDKSFHKEWDPTEPSQLSTSPQALINRDLYPVPSSAYFSQTLPYSSLRVEKSVLTGNEVFPFTEDVERDTSIGDVSKNDAHVDGSVEPSNTSFEIASNDEKTSKLSLEYPTYGNSKTNSEIVYELNDSAERKYSRATRNAAKKQLSAVSAVMEDHQCSEQFASSRLSTNQMIAERDDAVHTVEMAVTIIVKDINDNAPVFPNITMFGEIQENGPAELSVAQVSAWDADDATEGTNARITYFIEKNVIHDKTGDAIFNVEPHTGLITTALCCLDRETTPEYYIQVVASDGGGLKGTGTVVVRLSDENDNSPRLARKSWELEVYETFSDGPPNNITLLEMTAADPDSKNDFSFRVVKDSGPGWNLFGIRSSGASGQLYALQPLDYEDDIHRQGFRFMVQVTDRGQEGWDNPRHQDTAWVGVRLKDLNDNPPYFKNTNSRITVSEDAVPGTLLLNMTANDPDMGRGGRVKYQIEGEWDALKVDEGGSIHLYRPLDRELDEDSMSLYRVLASDQGNPSLTSTATLTITVLDVNDCPPRLLPPTVLHVQEGEPPVMLGVLTATDDDVWALGHGPPFSLSLAPTNPPHIFDLIELKFNQYMDSGRGGAEVWTRDTLDRETNRELLVDVLLVDAGNLNTTQTITIVVGDLNDNPMKPASKTVYLWKTQNIGSAAPLGRVYVDDPDDWDVGDKTFHWAGKPHPLFSLNSNDGTIYASSHVREGRYDLQFSVNDQLWKQVDVSANVSVVVRVLTNEALTHATPINLTPTTPTDLTRGWTPSAGGGKLGKLIDKIEQIIDDGNYKVDVVSVYGTDSNPSTAFISFTSSSNQADPYYLQDHRHPRNPLDRHTENHRVPYTCVWICAIDVRGKFMDLIKLQGLLALNVKKLENTTGLVVTFKEPSSDFEKSKINLQSSPSVHSYHTAGKGFQISGSPGDPATSTLKHATEEGLDRVASMASTVLPLQVVDTNITSLVTPLLLRPYKCDAAEISSVNDRLYVSDSCTPSSCLNGGKCVRFPTGNRCICPGGSKGPHCKTLSRSFKGNGWVWLKPLPSCLPVSISFRLLTTRRDALLLYQGPLVPPDSSEASVMSMLTVQIVNDWPQLLFEGFEESLKLQVNKTVSDGDWHSIHVRLDERGVAIMVDLCGLGWDAKMTDDSHCVARAAWSSSVDKRMWETSGPLQLGGVAQSHLNSAEFGWKTTVTSHSLEGCISHFMINDQVMNLSEPPYSQRSTSGCQLQDSACSRATDTCGIRGECVGGLRTPVCQCDFGWSGVNCESPTVPTTLGTRSYMRIALSFTPPSEVIVVEIRIRTLGSQTGTLLHLVGQHTNNSFTLQLQSGVACASMSGAGWGVRMSCVMRHPVGDGKWHTIRAERHGHNLLTTVDDGDDGRFNYSLPSLETLVREEFRTVTAPPMPLEIDKHDGVSVGGIPQFSGASLLGVQDDLQETCISDIRVSGHQLPLPPMLNGSSWGQVTTTNGLTKGCQSPSSCLNMTCKHPLSCHASWMHPSCSCGPGRQFVDHICVDVDECLLEPCLHGGTCYNLEPGYECLCGPGHLGDHCEWTKVTGSAYPLSAPVVVAAITFSFFILVVLGIFLSIRHHRLRTARRKESIQKRNEEALDRDTFLDPEADEVIVEVIDKKKKKKDTLSEKCQQGQEQSAKCPEDESHTTFLELLKLSRTKPQKEELRGSGEGEKGGINMAVITTQEGAENKGTSSLPRHQHHVLRHPQHQPHLPGEDLRNYAYEGDGSSSGSLSSTLSGLQTDLDKEEDLKPISKEFGEVMDLLKNLPDAPRSSSLLRRLKFKEKPCQEAVHDSRATLIKSKVSLVRPRDTKNPDIGGGVSPPSTPKVERSTPSPLSEKVYVGVKERGDMKTTAC
ncbi:putative neural-cadherin 2 isoform X2 [Macrobrachium nipponense]|uniref:putative neural-cadherin 2 isoform X2 n=1 Tax=Macrobrachium nipponense TaxID=159736 RepID=UPI0030C7E0E9